MKKRKNIIIVISLFLVIGLATTLLEGVSEKTKNKDHTESSQNTEKVEIKDVNLIQPEGMSVLTRIDTPEGFLRTEVETGSFAEFVRNYSVKEDGSPVHLYNGTNKSNQSVHAAVFNLPIENEDLQQCADSIMRMYAEYYYSTGQYNKIRFHFVSGFLAEYSKWVEGYRISVKGNNVTWVKKTDYDNSYETFKKYMRIVFSYASTLSMEKESESISLEDLQIGDIFIKGGSPGHVVMVVDVCENEQGEKAFLLAQGYMPAQEFHILKNPMNEDGDPWYYEDEISYPFKTPEYTFEEGSLKRLKY